MIRKWKDSRGLTLVEMLCAVAILVLLGLLVNTGLNLAMRAYRDMTAQSELELLAASLTDAIADDLRYAKKVNTSGDGELTHYHSERYNTNENQTTRLTVDTKDGQLYANEYRVLPSGSYGNGTYKIVGDEFKITYKDGLFTVELTVKQAEGDLSAKAEFTVRCLNYKPAA